MLHIVARTVRGRLMFTNWVEGLEVWRCVLRVAPQPAALCVMPDHLHLLVDQDVRAKLGKALSGLARRRNHRTGQGGSWFEPLPEATEVVGEKKRQRSLRYVHLNPCRAGLTSDPLSWPLSTHRDAVGLTSIKVGPRRQPVRFHTYVSSDPHVSPQGTELPGLVTSTTDPLAVLVAVTAVTRVPYPRIRLDRHARGMAIGALGDLCPLPQRQLATLLGVSRTTVRATPVPPMRELERVASVVGDPRFGPIDEASLLRLRGWRRYTGR
jgi:hypothetical protein